MSDITEGDLLAAIVAEYDRMRKLPGDVTVIDLFRELRKIDPSVTKGQAEYQFKLAKNREDVIDVEVLENGKRMTALRKKP